ncbi:MAG TPA: type IV secretory system conjugative DNA transfer family protein [Acidimicrobiales bacterium]|nr:type IV secretory system conjugative DNA transfer family protein [Acidimicrobiales bacterium]
MVDSDGVYLGRGTRGVATSGAQRSTLVLGPTRSGKTSSIIIPNLLMTSDACVVTSTKDDVVTTMARTRRDVATLLFDPSGTVATPEGVTRVGYTPLRQAQRWDGAVLVARTLLDVSRRNVERAEDHWSERAGALLAPLLHAAALHGEPLGQLATRVDERRVDDLGDVLVAHHGDHHASVATLRGVLATEERERSSIWSTAAGLFAGLRTDAARAASLEPLVDLDAFLAGGHHLHVVSPSRHQAVATPLVVGLIDEIVHATYERHRDGGRLLLALDELANVAPLPRLTSIVSEGGGQGVVTLACLQDLSQARARWGAGADGLLSLFPSTLVFPGIADRSTLEAVERLGGREFVASPTVHRDHRGRARSLSSGWVERTRVTASDVARGRPGHALALSATNDLRWVALTPYYADPLLTRHHERSRALSRDLER